MLLASDIFSIVFPSTSSSGLSVSEGHVFFEKRPENVCCDRSIARGCFFIMENSPERVKSTEAPPNWSGLKGEILICPAFISLKISIFESMSIASK